MSSGTITRHHYDECLYKVPKSGNRKTTLGSSESESKERVSANPRMRLSIADVMGETGQSWATLLEFKERMIVQQLRMLMVAG